MFFLLIAGVVGAIAYGVYRYLDGNGDYWKNLGVDSLGKSELASFWDRITFNVGPMEYDLRCYERFKGQKYAGLVEFRIPTFYLRDLDLIKRVLVKDFDHFVDRRIMELNKEDYVFQKMLTQKTGKEWKDLRSTMSPTFSTGKIRRMFHYFNVCGDKFARYMKDLEKTDNIQDFQDAFARYTVDVIASVVFGIQTDTFTNQDSVFRKMAKKGQTFSYPRMMKFVTLLFTPKIFKYLGLTVLDKESSDFFVGLVNQSIKRRRELGEKREDFLQMMLEAQSGQLAHEEEKELDDYEKDAQFQHESGSKKDLAVVLDDETVVSQTMLFFFAGFDTTESVLDFAAYELALNPDVQERLAEEITPVMEEHQGSLTYECVQNLPYLDMVVSETLRHHSPAFATERHCTQEYKVPDSDIILTKGMRVMIPINAIHHDPDHYSDPNKFNPEHFSAENKAKRHPYAYMPFGLGPRNCIAMRFALMEAKVAIAHLVYNFKLEPCSKTEIPMQVSSKATVKKPANGLWLQFHSRETTSEGFVKL